MPSVRAAADYVSGDRIPCLICGKPCLSVCHHARRAHGISARDYKLRFGLPVSRGVAAPESREAWRESMLNSRASGAIVGGNLPPYKLRRVRQIPAYASTDMRRLDPQAEVDLVLHHLRAGCTLHEACRMPDAPRWSWLHVLLKREPTMRAQFDATVEALPFSQQARMKMLGARFSAAVAAMHGTSAAAIAREIGVGADAIRREINRQKEPK